MVFLCGVFDTTANSPRAKVLPRNLKPTQTNKDLPSEKLPAGSMDVNYDPEDRELRVILIERLNLVTDLLASKGMEVFKNIMRDITKCTSSSRCIRQILIPRGLGVIWLHDCAKILHRDISVNNVIYRVNDTGQYFGVLGGFDLAAPIEPSEDPHDERTGTLPFMAIELLALVHPFDDDPLPIVHRLRHDLESAFWVIIWIAVQYPEAEREPRALSDWSIHTFAESARAKQQALAMGLKLTSLGRLIVELAIGSSGARRCYSMAILTRRVTSRLFNARK